MAPFIHNTEFIKMLVTRTMLFACKLHRIATSTICHRLRTGNVIRRAFANSRVGKDAYPAYHSTELTAHLEGTSSLISDYWIAQLKRVERQLARDMIPRLVAENHVGYENPGSRLLQFVLEQKKIHPEKVIVLRCGDFYEVYGVDAVMFVAYAGLNPMRGPKTVRAGCPVAGIQATLDGLTNSGLSAAIYEEIEEPSAAPGPVSKRLKQKQRAFSHIVSPGATVYPYKLSLKTEDYDFSVNKPFIGIHGTVSNGYNVCEIRLDEQSIVQYSRLSEDAVMSLLASSGYVEPVYVQNAESLGKYLSLSQKSAESLEVLHDYKDQDFHQIVLRKVCLANGISEADLGRFRLQAHTATDRPSYIYPQTAAQIGLHANPNVPDLIKSILPSSHPAHSARFLRKWISMPPPKGIADDMQRLCRVLHDAHVSLPSSCRPFQVGKAIQLLHTGQCNASVFREIHQCAVGVQHMLLETHHSESHEIMTRSLLSLTSFQTGTTAQHDILFENAQAIVTAIEGVVADVGQEDSPSAAAPALSPSDSGSGSGSALPPSLFDWQQLLAQLPPKDCEVVQAFFAHNEIAFRGHVLPSHPDVQQIYTEIDIAAKQLVQALLTAFFPSTSATGDYSVGNTTSSRKAANLDFAFHDNMLTCKVKPVVVRTAMEKEDLKAKQAENEKDAADATYYHPVDRKGQTLVRRFTTTSVEEALHVYRLLANDAPRRVEGVLRGLCSELLHLQMGIIHISNWALVLQATYGHAVQARRQGWCLPILVSFPSAPSSSGGKDKADEAPAALAAVSETGAEAPAGAFVAKGMSAWWMDRRNPSTVLNDIALEDIILLTAPNMSGKSTLMRTLLVTALLANCGLFVPCHSAIVPRYSSFFLRATSYDIPAESMSAFAIEMDDMHVVLRDSTSHSLVMVDEIGRGTSSRDGASLAGAILEALSDIGVTGIFSTHLHEVLKLPLQLPRLQLKQMGFEIDKSKDRHSKTEINNNTTQAIKWTYLLQDGICTDSMGLETARVYGLPTNVIRRAAELSGVFDRSVRSGADVENQLSGSEPSVAASASQDFYESFNDWAAEQALVGGTTPMETKMSPQEAFYSGQVQVPSDISYQGGNGAVTAVHDNTMYSEMDNHQKLKGLEELNELVDWNQSQSLGQGQQRLQGQQASTGPVYALEAVVPLMKSLTGTHHEDDVCVIESSHEPAAAFEGHTCVYILHVSSDSSPDCFYVGETEVVADRLRRHRMVTFKGSNLRMAVIRASNKSNARMLESQLITALKQDGYVVQNDSDSRHKNFGSSC